MNKEEIKKILPHREPMLLVGEDLFDLFFIHTDVPPVAMDTVSYLK